VQKASVVLITDESGSMAATDVDPTRLGAAETAARAFLAKAPSSLMVGFVGYSSGVETSLDPTTDRAQITSAVDELDADGGTATGDALTVALDELQARKGKDGRQAPAAIVLLSDGASNQGSDPLAAARRAQQLHIPIYTVALGTQSGTLEAQGQLIPVPPDPATLQQISSISGGTAYATADADQLAGVYKDLGSKIGTKQVKQDVSANVAGLGLVLLLGGLAAGVRRRSRLA
jgi:Ca-activated chloride channel family protein